MFVKGELLSGLWVAEVDFLISVHVLISAGRKQKEMIGIMHSGKRFQGLPCKDASLLSTLNTLCSGVLGIAKYECYSSVWITTAPIMNLIHMWEANKPTSCVSSVKTNILKSSYLYSAGKALIWLAIHKSQRYHLIWHEPKILNCKWAGLAND